MHAGAGRAPGRSFLLLEATPMDTATSGYLTQDLAWVLAKKLRRLGVQALSYSGDSRIWCKPKEIAPLVEMVDTDVVAHGLLSHPRKRKAEGVTDDVALGIGMNLRVMHFYIPAEKNTEIAAACRQVAKAARDKKPI